MEICPQLCPFMPFQHTEHYSMLNYVCGIVWATTQFYITCFCKVTAPRVSLRFSKSLTGLLVIPSQTR
jgi:hypothetical protein